MSDVTRYGPAVGALALAGHVVPAASYAKLMLGLPMEGGGLLLAVAVDALLLMVGVRHPVVLLGVATAATAVGLLVWPAVSSSSVPSWRRSW